MKQFCIKIDLIPQGREHVLFLPSNMAAMTSHENALYIKSRLHLDLLEQGKHLLLLPWQHRKWI